MAEVTPPKMIRLSIPQAIERAVSFHKKGQFADAEKIYVDLLKMEPNNFDLLHLFGVLRYQQGQAAAALPLLEAAFKLRPDLPELLSNYGLALRAMGRRDEALEIFDKALKINPRSPETLANRGHLLTDLDRLPEALESFGRALIERRDFVDALVGRGVILQRMKRYVDALVSFNRAIELDPKNVDVLLHRAAVLYELKRYGEIVETCDRALTLDPRRALLHYNRAVALGALGRMAEALVSYERAIALNPNHVESYFNRGNVLQSLGRFQDALASFQRVIALDPQHARAWNNSGNVLLELKRHDEALKCFDRVIELEPAFGEAYYNRGNVLLELERIPEALEHYKKAASLRGDISDIPFNEGIARLLLGDLREGFKRYEGRFDKREQAPLRRNFPQPLWSGEDLSGKTILLHSEQGHGDSIQFVRYAPLLARQGARVILEVHEPLQTLLQGVEGVARTVTRDQPLPAFDTHQHLLSLPNVFGTELGTIPADVPYIQAPADRIAKWRDRIPRTEPLRVGLCWSGNPEVKIDARRSIGLARLAPLLSVAGVQFVSLHREVRPEHAEALRSLPQLLHFGEEISDFADTAAVISELDLVISSDTAVLHLAGAMGKPLWILTSLSPDWRWLLQREDSPWYPTAKLYRQPRMDDWESVIERVRGDLMQLVQSTRDRAG